MKQAILTTLAICLLAAGVQAQETKTKDETAQGKPMKMKQEKDKMKGDMRMQSTDLPYQATYSSQFRMGNPMQAKEILQAFRAYENNDFSNANALADTMTLITADGHVFKGRDMALNAFKQQRAGVSSSKFTISAVLPTHSIDRNEDWVAVWGSQQFSMANDNTQNSAEFNSIWRFNKAGKVDFVQFFEGKTPTMQQ